MGELLKVVVDFSSTFVKGVCFFFIELLIVDLTIASIYVAQCIEYFLHSLK